MKTQNQLRAEIYNALYANSTLPNDIYWIARPTVINSPIIVYNVLDTTGAYVYGSGAIVRSSEDFTVQVDIYVSPEEVNLMDSYMEAVKTVMETINYRNLGSPVEFFETDINKVVRPTRWERLNV